MNAPIPSTFRRHRTLLLVTAGIVWLLVLIVLLTWWLLPRWAPEFVIRHAPMPDMVFRAVLVDDTLHPTGFAKLCTMGFGATPTLIAHLQHPDEYARRMALDILMVTRDPHATEAILALLDDPRETFPLQNHAIRTLGEIGDLRAIPRLMQLASRQDFGWPWSTAPVPPGDGLLAVQAAEALSAIPGPAVGDALRPLLEQQERWALSVFEWSRDPRVPGWLNAEMRRPFPDGLTVVSGTWQNLAAQTLAGNLQPVSSTLLRTALTDASPLLRKTAANCVGIHASTKRDDVERTSVITALITLLTDPDPEVSQEAWWALPHLGAYLTPEQQAHINSVSASRPKPP